MISQSVLSESSLLNYKTKKYTLECSLWKEGGGHNSRVLEVARNPELALKDQHKYLQGSQEFKDLSSIS